MLNSSNTPTLASTVHNAAHSTRVVKREDVDMSPVSRFDNGSASDSVRTSATLVDEGAQGVNEMKPRLPSNMASSSDLSELEDDNSEGGDEASDAEAETEKWSTQVPEFLALLARKDEIFDLRRRNDDEELQKKSTKSVSRYFRPKKAETSSIYRTHLGRLESFALDNNVPLYPITADMVALLLHNMYQNGMRPSSTLASLGTLRSQTRDIWEGRPAADAYEGPLPSYPAIKKLLSEQTPSSSKSGPEPRTAPTRNPPPTSSAGPSASSSRSESASPSLSFADLWPGPTPHIPNLPTVGSRFESPTALVRKINTVQIPRLGIAEDGNAQDWVVVGTGTDLQHNHGPNPKLVGLTKAEDCANVSNAVHLTRQLSKTSHSTHSTQSRKRPPSPTPLPSSAPRKTASKQREPTKITDGYPRASRHRPSPSNTYPGPSHPSPLPISRALSSFAPPSPPPIMDTSPPHPFLAHLSTFLNALHPSLVALANAFVTKGGITSLEPLVSLVMMQDESREVLFKTLKVSPLQCALLKGKLRLLEGLVATKKENKDVAMEFL